MTNTQIKVFVGLVFVVTAALLLIKGQPPSQDYWSTFSTVATVVVFVLLLWEQHLWAWPVLRLLSNRPDIRGTWKGVVQSDWKDPVNGEAKEPLEVYVVIRQTYSTLDIRLFSCASNSTSLSANLTTDSAGVHSLAVTYLNAPSALNLEKSPISHGGMLLALRGTEEISQIDGKYWTDRKTLGEIVLTRRVRRICHHFNEAKQRHSA